MLSSAEHEIYPAHNNCWHFNIYKHDNTTSERLKARNVFICRYFRVYERLKDRTQLSWAWRKFYNPGACCLLFTDMLLYPMDLCVFFCVGSLLCCVNLGVISSLAIILLMKRELVALIKLWHCYICPVSLPHGAADWSVDCGIVSFLGQNHLLFDRASCKAW